jgi:hypothetical protein
MTWASYNGQFVRTANTIVQKSSIHWCSSVWTGDFHLWLVIILDTFLYTRNRQISCNSVQQPPKLNLVNQKIETVCSSETSGQTHTKNMVTQRATFQLPLPIYLYISSVYTLVHVNLHVYTHRIGVCVLLLLCVRWVYSGVYYGNCA